VLGATRALEMNRFQGLPLVLVAVLSVGGDMASGCVGRVTWSTYSREPTRHQIEDMEVIVTLHIGVVVLAILLSSTDATATSSRARQGSQ
jgi:hypothetical protein